MQVIWTGRITSSNGRRGMAIIWGDRSGEIIAKLRDENKELRIMNDYLRKECKSLQKELRSTSETAR